MAQKRIPKKIIKIIKEYTYRLKEKKKLPIERVIIFGSRAKGRVGKWSDIDVCIISPQFKDALGAIEFLLKQRERKEVIAGLEPVGFTENDFKKGGSFIEEIKKTGVEVR